LRAIYAVTIYPTGIVDMTQKQMEKSFTYFPSESTVVTTARFCNEQMHNSKLLSVLYVYTEMPTWVNKNMGGKVFKKGRNFGIPKSM